MPRYNLMGSTGFAIPKCDESGTASDMSEAMWLYTWGFSEPSIIWQLSDRDVTCGICDHLGMISRFCISSQNVVGDGVAAVVSVHLNSVILASTPTLTCSLSPLICSLTQLWHIYFPTSDMLCLTALTWLLSPLWHSVFNGGKLVAIDLASLGASW